MIQRWSFCRRITLNRIRILEWKKYNCNGAEDGSGQRRRCRQTITITITMTWPALRRSDIFFQGPTLSLLHYSHRFTQTSYKAILVNVNVKPRYVRTRLAALLKDPVLYAISRMPEVRPPYHSPVRRREKHLAEQRRTYLYMRGGVGGAARGGRAKEYDTGGTYRLNLSHPITRLQTDRRQCTPSSTKFRQHFASPRAGTYGLSVDLDRRLEIEMRE